MTEMNRPNVINLLGVAAKEDVHTNLFTYCIEHSPQFRNSFLTSVLGWPADTELSKVRTRLSLREIGVPDIVVVGTNGRRKRLGVVEVKLHAEEGHDQTTRYASEECLREICKALELKKDDLTATDMVFFTLYPDQCPKNEDFRRVCIKGLATKLTSNPVNDDPTAAMLLHSWTDCLNEFYEGENLDDNDLLGCKLNGDSQLGSGFLAFSTFFRSTRMPSVEFSQPWRGNPAGHPYYGINLGKAHWAPDTVTEDRTGEPDWTKFNPAKHFNIHIECQFDRKYKNIKLFAHYETNPYFPHLKRLVTEGRLREARFEGHMMRRNEFRRRLMGFLSGQFTPARKGSVNTIAYTTVPTKEKTVGDARSVVGSLLLEMTHAVDQTLKLMGTKKAK